ncbi:MAG: RecX family transcriptional regulator [Candidatus Latescibacterota bacterium]|nr:MAG: RecX family transcriptional regulator [Candidatus Latescibacterota bacterium]
MSESVVQWKPRPRNRVFIKLSGGRFFTIPEAEGEALKPGTKLSEEAIERLSRIDQYFRGRDKSMRLLAIRSRSRYEIESTLDGMGIAPEIRNGILGELQESGLIDDVRFTREYVSSRIELKQLGPHRLRFDLKKFRVSAAIAHQVLNDAFPPGRQEELAWAIVRKKLRTAKAQEKDIRRIRDLLRRKGLDYEIINHVAYELLKKQGREQSLDQ